MAHPASDQYKLLSILQGYAPDGAAQNRCTELLHEMESAGESSDRIVLTLAGFIVDGLQHGNWPWVVARGSRPA